MSHSQHIAEHVDGDPESWSPFAARLAVGVIWLTLAHARRGEATDEQMKLALGVAEMLSAYLERLEFEAGEP